MTDETFSAPEAAGTLTSDRAGFAIRFGASLIDGILSGIVWIVLGLLLGDAGYAIGWILSMAYYVVFEGGESGQTPGKSACGIAVRGTDGRPIGYGRAFIRYLGRILSSIPLYLGYFWMLWDGDKQTWHDKLARSVVVPVWR